MSSNISGDKSYSDDLTTIAYAAGINNKGVRDKLNKENCLKLMDLTNHLRSFRAIGTSRPVF